MSAAVEGRDERAAHGQKHLPGDLVGIVLTGHDFPAVAGHRLAALQQLAESLRTRDQRVRMTDEQLDEALLLRHERLEPCKHSTLAVRNNRATWQAGSGPVPGQP